MSYATHLSLSFRLQLFAQGNCKLFYYIGEKMTTSQTDKNHISISEGKFSMERVFTIYNDRTGDKMEFGPDMDGLDLWELRQYANDGNSMKITDRIILTQEQVSLLALAFQEVAEKHPIIRSFDRE